MSSVSLMSLDSSEPYKQPEIAEPMQIETDNAKWFDLIPDRNLLDANFEGYKLSLDQFAQYKLDLNDDLKLNTYNLTDGESKHKFFLYQHIKLFGMQNLLIVNNYDDSNLYYFDSKLRLVKIIYNIPKLVPVRKILPTNLVLPNSQQLIESIHDRTNPTIKFISETSAVIFDGYETLYICEIDQSNKSDDQLSEEKWIIKFQWKASSSDKCQIGILKDAVLFENKIDVLVMSVNEVSDIKNTKFDTIINWFTFQYENEWSLRRTRRINCYNSVPDYVSLETNGQSVYIAAPSFAKFVYDSQKNIRSVNKTSSNNENGSNKPTSTTDDVPASEKKFYTWNQSNDEINVNLLLEKPNVKKDDLSVKLNYDSIEILLENQLILSGSFSSTIKMDESVWTLNNTNENSIIEFVLSKSNPGQVWTSFLKDNDRFGEFKSEAQSEVGLMDQFTSESKARGNETKTLFQLEQQLEECDEVLSDQFNSNVENEENFLMFRRLDGNLHQATHKSFINDNKFLFDVKLSPNKSSALCLRHDVDGILWQPHRVSPPASADTILATHEYTFLAFGYVQASKQDTKFRSCSPNCSYVCIADTNKHIYVYKQESEKLENQLKNRKTGKIITKLAKQYLISLDSEKEIYGLYCSNDFMIVLLREACYLFKINQDSN